MKNLKSLMMGMLVGLVTGPLLVCLLASLYIAATDYRSLAGEDWPWIITGLISVGFISGPQHLLLGGIIGFLAHRLNYLFCMILGGVYGTLAGFFTSRWVEIEYLRHGEHAYLFLSILSGFIIAILVKRIASSKIPIDWDVDLSGDRRSKYLPDRPQE